LRLFDEPFYLSTFALEILEHAMEFRFRRDTERRGCIIDSDLFRLTGECELHAPVEMPNSVF
jgi:hypothetical protein